MGLTVIRPGMLTTIQDLGRWGRQESGVPVAGPMAPQPEQFRALEKFEKIEQAARQHGKS